MNRIEELPGHKEGTRSRGSSTQGGTRGEDACLPRGGAEGNATENRGDGEAGSNVQYFG